MALVLHVGHPRKKRERRETIAVSRYRAHTEDHPPPAHTKGRGAQEASKNPRRKWWSLFPDSKNEIKNKK